MEDKKNINIDKMKKNINEACAQLKKIIEDELEKRKKADGSVELDGVFKEPVWSASPFDVDLIQALNIVTEKTGIEFVGENGRWKPKDYLELPTYEDGTHVHFGDEYVDVGCESANLEYITYKNGDIYSVMGRLKTGLVTSKDITNNNPLKKPLPTLESLREDIKNGFIFDEEELLDFVDKAYQIGLEEGRKK